MCPELKRKCTEVDSICTFVLTGNELKLSKITRVVYLTFLSESSLGNLVLGEAHNLLREAHNFRCV